MRVLFVCTGNTCRSPMLEYAFKNYVKSLGIDGIAADSAGTMRQNKPMSEEAKAVLRTHSIVFDKNKISKFCDEELIKNNDFIITATRSQADYLDKLYGCGDKTISICDLTGRDMRDPHGKGLEAYEAIYEEIETALPKLLAFITKTDV